MKYKTIIAKMTLEEKASLMSGKDFWTTQELEQHNIPSIYLADGPHGIRKQAAKSDNIGLNASIPATCYPTAATVANSWNIELAEEIGFHLGKEAKSQKVNVLLGPGTNIKRNPLCGRNFEYFSEDPLLAGKMSAAYIRGIQSTGISACLKHFAANNQEFRRMAIDSIIDERTLREIYLTPFRIGIKEGNLKCLMTSYNKVNGYYTNENQHLMLDVLRKTWEYDGVVVTDWGGSNDRVKGLKAMSTLEMPSPGGQTNKEIVEAVKSGLIEESLLDENVDKLLTLIFDTEKAFATEVEDFNREEHHKFAQRVAEESIVLLKNDNLALPLNNQEKIAIIGDFAKTPRYQGAGSSIVNPTKLDNTIEINDEFNLNYVGFEPGYHRYGKFSKKLIQNAVELAKKADTVLLYIGLDEHSEAEGLDRKHMNLPSNQLALLDELSTLGKKLIVVLSCGSAVLIDFDDKVDAIVHTYLSGQAGAKATMSVLTGKVNPCGKLSETIPHKYEDLATANNFPGKEVTAEYREGLFVGYRYFDTVKKSVKYPFGFGLSYTDFAYSNLLVSTNEIRFNIKNTGDQAGAEVAQVYISAVDSKVYRPNKELKAFTKVMLEPKEEKEVVIKLTEDAFSFYNVETMKWEVEELDYQILVGSSSQNIRLRETLRVPGVKLNPKLTKTDIPTYFKGNVEQVEQSEFEALLGKDVPKANFSFYKKNRLIVDYNTTVAQLRYAKGFTGRLVARFVRFLVKFYHFLGKHETANILIMGIMHLPVRGLSRMSGGKISWGQLQGMMLMFNGKFFKGLSLYLKEGRMKRRK